MARQRTPLDKAKTLGRDLKDPKRFRNRTDPLTAPLGDPPAWLKKEAIKEWKTLAAEFPWLRKSDRALVAITAHTAALIRENPDRPVAFIGEHRRQLCALGGSPADRSKIFMPNEDPSDPLEEFVQ